MRMSIKWRIAQFFEIRWWQSYLSKRDVEVYLDQKRKYWKKILALCPFQVDPLNMILDAGCGPAGIFMILDYDYVDAIDPLIDQYEQKLPHFSRVRYPEVRFWSLGIEEFEPKWKYEYVFCMNAINHVRDISKSIQNLSKCTSKDGWLTLAIDTHKWKMLKSLFKTIPGDLLHPHQYDLEEYQQMLSANHFEIIQSKRLKQGFIFDYHIIFAQKKDE